MKRFEVLDSFRGLAAIFVVIFHMHFLGVFSELTFFRNSGIFVEFFFILSGFVLTHSYAYAQDISFKTFIVTRTFRLFPLHIFMLLIFIFLEVLKLIAYLKFNISFGAVPFTEEKAVDEILPNMFLLQAWLVNAKTTSWNFPSWSISVEYYIYLIFFITILFKNDSKQYLWLSIVGFVFYAIHFNFNIKNEILNGLVCFFVGALAYAIYRKFNNKIDRLTMNRATMLELISLFAIIYSVSRNIENYYIIGIFVVTIFIFSTEKGHLSHFFKQRIFSYFGKISYSIYLIHAVILFCFSGFLILLEKLLNKQLHIVEANIKMINLGVTLNNFSLIFILSIIILLSHYSYIYRTKRTKTWKKVFARA